MALLLQFHIGYTVVDVVEVVAVVVYVPYSVVVVVSGYEKPIVSFTVFNLLFDQFLITYEFRLMMLLLVMVLLMLLTLIIFIIKL